MADFIIQSPEFQVFEVDHKLLARVNNGEFGDQTGLAVISKIVDYKEGLLTILTKMQYIALQGGKMLEVVESYSSSHFMFVNLTVLKRGITDSAMKALQKCFNLAEAQSYSVFIHLSSKNGLPLSGMEITPTEKYIYDFRGFLADNQYPLN